MANHAVTSVDLGKSVFEIAVSLQPGRVSERKTLSRSKFLSFFANRPVTTVVMEACGSSHYWARQLQLLGREAVLLPPSLVRPYVRRNKTNRTDAKGILEAYRNEEIHPVPIKSVDQQTITSLHRARSGWMHARTARIHTVRGLLRELGVFLPAGAKRVVPAAAARQSGRRAVCSNASFGARSPCLSSAQEPGASQSSGREHRLVEEGEDVTVRCVWRGTVSLWTPAQDPI